MVFRIVQIGALSREEQFVTEILNWYRQVLLAIVINRTVLEEVKVTLLKSGQRKKEHCLSHPSVNLPPLYWPSASHTSNSCCGSHSDCILVFFIVVVFFTRGVIFS
jgi:hypothetical protein